MHAVRFKCRQALVVMGSVLATGLLAASPAAGPPTGTAVLAGGCFWGMQDVFEKLRGVRDVQAGYAGGSASTAHYEMVSTGTTGQAESVRITFDPRVISYQTLLEVYFTVAHDPTELDRQGPDNGTQYRSAIFFATPTQQRTARAEIADLERRHVYEAPIVTQVEPLHGFYPAEAYHQHFADRNPDDPYIVAIDAPKIVALRKAFGALLKPRS